jgi:hypothetical protein
MRQIEVFDEDVHDDDDTMGRASVSVVAWLTQLQGEIKMVA